MLLLIALSSGLAALALRDGREDRLDREAQRLAALLEAARAQARATGVAVRFELAAPREARDGGEAAPDFRFTGLPPELLPPGRWLDPQVQAQIAPAAGAVAGALRLGPEPLIGAQRIVLHLGDRRLALATDGLAPFAVEPPAAAAAP